MKKCLKWWCCYSSSLGYEHTVRAARSYRIREHALYFQYHWVCHWWQRAGRWVSVSFIHWFIHPSLHSFLYFSPSLALSLLNKGSIKNTKIPPILGDDQLSVRCEIGMMTLKLIWWKDQRASGRETATEGQLGQRQTNVISRWGSEGPQSNIQDPWHQYWNWNQLKPKSFR